MLMATTGIRLGALPTIRYRHLKLIESHNLYKIKIYANSADNAYYTFCTPEAKGYIDQYLESRRSRGEVITDKSPLLRNEFDDKDQDRLKILNPKPVSKHTIRKQFVGKRRSPNESRFSPLLQYSFDEFRSKL